MLRPRLSFRLIIFSDVRRDQSKHVKARHSCRLLSSQIHFLVLRNDTCHRLRLHGIQETLL